MQIKSVPIGWISNLSNRISGPRSDFLQPDVRQRYDGVHRLRQDHDAREHDSLLFRRPHQSQIRPHVMRPWHIRLKFLFSELRSKNIISVTICEICLELAGINQRQEGANNILLNYIKLRPLDYCAPYLDKVFGPWYFTYFT